MPIYDYKCGSCGTVFEDIGMVQDKFTKCPECNRLAKRIISASGVFCSNDDSKWVRSVVDVVDKKSKNPATQEFVRHPTRQNLQNHLKANGLRHVDPGERLGNTNKPFDVDRHTERLVQHRQSKKAIELRG